MVVFTFELKLQNRVFGRDLMSVLCACKCVSSADMRKGRGSDKTNHGIANMRWGEVSWIYMVGSGESGNKGTFSIITKYILQHNEEMDGCVYR